ncbi:MAG: ATP-binding protein, partial [Sciscionella sp.]
MARRITTRALIGRAEQLASLRVATETARAGSASLVLVAGDAGIGKSRLVEEAVTQARADGLLAVVGGCVQLGEVSVAFAPLAEALRDLRAQLDGSELSGMLPEPASLLGDAGAARGSGPLFERVLGFLAELAGVQPLLLVFEDLHWADASTRDLVAFLGRNLRASPITLVLT